MAIATININNYEAFLLDHFEGNLSDEQNNELRSFIDTHPELNIDLNKHWDGNKLDPNIDIESYFFPAELLKKTTPAMHELVEMHNLTEEMKEPSGEFALLIQKDSILRLHYTAYQQSKLTPNPEDKLDHSFKQSLRKSDSTQLKPMWLAIAAVALLLIISKLSTPIFTSDSTQQIAQVEDFKPTEKTILTENLAENQVSALTGTNSNKLTSAPETVLTLPRNPTVNKINSISQKDNISILTEAADENIGDVAVLNTMLPELEYIEGRQTRVKHKEIISIASVRINTSVKEVEKSNKIDGLISNGVMALLSGREKLQENAIKSIQYIDQNGLLGLSTSRSEKGQIESVTLRIADLKFYQSL